MAGYLVLVILSYFHVLLYVLAMYQFLRARTIISRQQITAAPAVQRGAKLGIICYANQLGHPHSTTQLHILYKKRAYSPRYTMHPFYLHTPNHYGVQLTQT